MLKMPLNQDKSKYVKGPVQSIRPERHKIKQLSPIVMSHHHMD